MEGMLCAGPVCVHDCAYILNGNVPFMHEYITYVHS